VVLCIVDATDNIPNDNGVCVRHNKIRPYIR
jgi:hypothetical protein